MTSAIPPQLKSRLQNGALVQPFLHKESRFAKLLQTFPLYVVMNTNLGIIGTREYAVRLLT